MQLPSAQDPRSTHPLLAALHDLVAEARRANGRLRDPDAVAIHALLPVDLDTLFGRPWPLHAARARALDEATMRFLSTHPGAVVVELGAGLSTRCFRTPGASRWLAVDRPQRIELRDQFIHEDAVLRHVACAPLNPRWLDALPDRPTLVLARGVFQTLDPPERTTLARRIADRLPGGTLLFDTLPWACREPGGPRPRDAHLTPRNARSTVAAWLPTAGTRLHAFAASPLIEGLWNTLGEPSLLEAYVPAIVEVDLP